MIKTFEEYVSENSSDKNNKRFIENNRKLLESIVSFSEIVKRAEEYRNNILDRETSDTSYVEVENKLWDKLADWHTKYEDEYYEKLKNIHNSYDEIMALRQTLAMKQVFNKEEFEKWQENEKRTEWEREEYRKDIDWEWRRSRGV